MTDVAALARIVDEAAHAARAIKQLSEREEISVADGYAIQAAAFGRRLARGERQVGVKMGFTSRAKMVQMGIDDMIWGRLSDAMLIEDGGVLDFPRYVHPRVEPEIAFLLARPLDGPVSAAEAMSAIEAVAPAREMVAVELAEPLEFMKRTCRRRTPPPQQRRPSPKGLPLPLLSALAPWKKSTGWWCVPWEIWSVSVSARILAEPLLERMAPCPVELAQPSPRPPVLPQGQGVPLPSP